MTKLLSGDVTPTLALYFSFFKAFSATRWNQGAAAPQLNPTPRPNNPMANGAKSRQGSSRRRPWLPPAPRCHPGVKPGLGRDPRVPSTHRVAPVWLCQGFHSGRTGPVLPRLSAPHLRAISASREVESFLSLFAEAAHALSGLLSFLCVFFFFLSHLNSHPGDPRRTAAAPLACLPRKTLQKRPTQSLATIQPCPAGSGAGHRSTQTPSRAPPLQPLPQFPLQAAAAPPKSPQGAQQPCAPTKGICLVVWLHPACPASVPRVK